MIKSEKKFKILFKNLLIPSFIWQKINDDFFLIDFNIAAEGLTEGKIENLLKVKASKLYSENPDIFNDLNRCVNHKVNFSRELDYNLKTTGERKSFQVKYNYIPPDLVVLHVKDITIQKKTQYQLKESEKKLKDLNKEVEQRISERIKELKKSEKKYRTLVNNISDVIVETDPAGKTIYVNPQNFEIFGYKPEELIGQNPFGLIHPKDVDKLKREMEKLINKEEAISVEYKALHRNGNYLIVSAKVGMFESEGKKRFVGVVRDITESRKIEEKLKRSEEKYKSLFNSSIQGIIVSDHEGKLISVNPAAASILGYNCPEELLGLSVIELYVDPTQKERIVQEMLKTGYLKDFEIQLKKKDNTPIDTSFSGTLHKDKEGNLLRIEMLFNDISERKKAEEKLKESEKKYKHLANELEMILDHIPGIVLYKDTENNIHRVNKFLADAHNLTKKEMEGVSCFNIYPKEQAQAYWDDDIEVIRSKKPKLNIIEPWEVGQDKKWVNMSKIPFIDEYGNVKGIIGMGTDITVAKLAEEKIKKSEEKYRALFETSTDGIGFVGLNGKFEEVNEALIKIFGYTLDEFKSMRFQEITPKKWHKMEEEIITNQILKRGYSDLYEKEAIRKDGTIIPVAIRAWLVRNGKGNPKRMMGILRDITDWKEFEQKLKESEEKYRNLFENSPNAIALINLNGIIYDCNFAYERIFGYKKEELIGQNFLTLSLYPPETLLLLQKRLKVMSKGERAESLEIKVFKKDGSLAWVSPDVSIVKIGNEPFIQFISQDITEKKNRELFIKEQNKKLTALNKLKTELMRRTSHELKTPLISIKGFADLLLNVYYERLDTDIISILEEIEDGCKRLENLINDILKSSELESERIELKPSMEDLSFLIRFCVSELKMLLKMRKQKIILNIHDKLITNFEKEKIYDVLSNLLSNAIKYSPPNSEIQIKSEVGDKFIVISIKDEGIGFSEKEKNQIFKQFGKIERYGQGWDIETEGSGLGLYISKKIVELHGGKIWIESEGRNKGSTFYFSLPNIKDR